MPKRKFIVCGLAKAQPSIFKVEGQLDVECCQFRRLVIVGPNNWLVIHYDKLEIICYECAREMKMDRLLDSFGNEKPLNNAVIRFTTCLDASDWKAPYLMAEGGEVECCDCGCKIYTIPENVPNILNKIRYAICPACAYRTGWRKDGREPEVSAVEEMKRLVERLKEQGGNEPPQGFEEN